MTPPNRRYTVLITTPSLELSHNVSGISSVVRGIIEGLDSRHSEWSIVPYVVGKRDSTSRRVRWLIGQLTLPFRFATLLYKVQPRIVHINGPLNQLAIFRDLFLVIIARITRITVIYHVHGGRYVHEAPSKKHLKFAIVLLLRNSRRIAVLGELEAMRLSRMYGVPSSKIVKIANAVPVPTKGLTRALNGRLKVLSIGRLSEEKGLKILCQAFEEDGDLADQINLELCGAGPLQDEVCCRLKSRLGKNFHFLGIVKDAEKERAYARADVVIIPSLRGEGLPIVLLEAMAFGAVPIATNDGLMGTLVIPGKTGLLISKGDVQSLIGALKEAEQLKINNALTKLSTAGKHLVTSRHSLEKQIDKILNMYAETDKCVAR